MEWTSFNSLFPSWWKAPLPESKAEVVVVYNWLDLQVPRSGWLEKVDELSHWRNREVYEYVKDYDWTARMYDKADATWYCMQIDAYKQFAAARWGA